MDSAPKRRSSVRVLIYLIIIGITVLILLQVTGTASVVNESEREELIERPHG